MSIYPMQNVVKPAVRSSYWILASWGTSSRFTSIPEISINQPGLQSLFSFKCTCKKSLIKDFLRNKGKCSTLLAGTHNNFHHLIPTGIDLERISNFLYKKQCRSVNILLIDSIECTKKLCCHAVLGSSLLTTIP